MFAALTEATREGDVEQVKHLVMANPLLIDTRSSGGWTPSLLAAYYNQPECVELFISKGANVNDRDDDGHLRRGVLHYLAGHGRAMTCLKLAKEYGGDPNLLDVNLHTPLHRACIGNHPLTVLVLLLVGANPLLCTEEGHLPSQLTDSALAHFFLLLAEKRCKAASSSVAAGRGNRYLPLWKGGGKEHEIDTEIVMLQKNGGGGYQNEGTSESPSTRSTTNSSVDSAWEDEENDESKYDMDEAESDADVEDNVDEESLLLVAAEAGKKDSSRRRRRKKGQQQQRQQLREPVSSLPLSSSSPKAQVYSIVV